MSKSLVLFILSLSSMVVTAAGPVACQAPCSSGLEFSGAQRAWAQNDPPLPTPPFTFGFWTEIGEPVGSNPDYILSGPAVSGPGGNYSWAFGVTTAEPPAIFLDLDVPPYAFPGPALPSRGWHHFALVFQSESQVDVWVDGALFHTYMSPGPYNTAHVDNTAATLNLGMFVAVDGWTERPYDGVVDELSLWDRALGGAEIGGLMTEAPDLSDPDLVSYWDFEEGTGQLAVDAKGVYSMTLGDTAAVDPRDPDWKASCPPYPGSGGDLVLATAVGGPVSTDASKSGSAGDIVTVQLETPAASLVGAPYAVLVGVLGPLEPVVPLPTLPVYVGSSPFFVVNGFTGLDFGVVLTEVPAVTGFALPAEVLGTQVVVQGVSVDAGSAYVFTDAHVVLID